MENDHDQFQVCVAALAVALAVATAASPALAKQRAQQPGHDARAQATHSDVGGDGMSGHRAQAIRECMEMSGKFSQSTWGNMSAQQYRTCMAEHGEVE
jgi:hypothetical protein